MYFSEEEEEKLIKVNVYLYRLDWEVYNDHHPKRRSHVNLHTHNETIDMFNLIRNYVESNKEMIRMTAWRLTRELKWSWSFGYDSSLFRVAPPDHKIFIVASSRDCDGIAGTDFLSFKSLYEANQYFEEVWYPSLEGPSDYCSVSAEEWEKIPHPEFRDPYAEMDGY